MDFLRYCGVDTNLTYRSLRNKFQSLDVISQAANLLNHFLHDFISSHISVRVVNADNRRVSTPAWPLRQEDYLRGCNLVTRAVSSYFDLAILIPKLRMILHETIDCSEGPPQLVGVPPAKSFVDYKSAEVV